MRGQVTIFILLGLVLLFSVGLLLYATISSNQKHKIEQQQLILEELRANTVVGQAMKTCLDEAARDGLTLLGKQGGYLVQGESIASDYGSLHPYSSDDKTMRVGGVPTGRPNFIALGSGDFVAVWIKNQGFDNSGAAGTFPTTPEYPCRKGSGFNFPWTPTQVQDLNGCLTNLKLDTPVNAYSYESLGGSNTLPLCESNQPIGCGTNPAGPCICTCDPANSDCDVSLQSSLQRYVDAQFEKCFDDIDISGYELELVSSNPYVGINEDSIDVSIQPVINVVALGGSVDGVVRVQYPVIEGSQIGLALKKIMDDLRLVMQGNHPNEINTPNHNLTKRLENLPLGIEINRQQINYDSINYHVFDLIMDNPNTLIAGTPWVFSFAIENRVPVLEPIEKVFNHNSNQITISNVCAVDPDELSVELEGGVVSSVSGSNPLLSFQPQTNPALTYTAPALCQALKITGMIKTGDYEFRVRALDNNSNPLDSLTYDHQNFEVKVRCSINPNNPATCAGIGNGYCLPSGTNVGQCTNDCNTYFKTVDDPATNYCIPNSGSSFYCDPNDKVNALSCGGNNYCCSNPQQINACSTTDKNTQNCLCGLAVTQASATNPAYCCSPNPSERRPLVVSDPPFQHNDLRFKFIPSGFCIHNTLFGGFPSGTVPTDLKVRLVEEKSPSSPHSITQYDSSANPSDCNAGFGGSGSWHKFDSTLSDPQSLAINKGHTFEFWYPPSATGINNLCP